MNAGTGFAGQPFQGGLGYYHPLENYLVERFQNNVAIWVKVFSCSGANILKLINLIEYVNTLTPEPLTLYIARLFRNHYSCFPTVTESEKE